jgi:hypothetical protein
MNQIKNGTSTGTEGGVQAIEPHENGYAEAREG